MTDASFFDTKPYDRRYFEASSQAERIRWRFHEFRLGPDTVGTVAGARAVCLFVNDRVDARCIDALARNLLGRWVREKSDIDTHVASLNKTHSLLRLGAGDEGLCAVCRGSKRFSRLRGGREGRYSLIFGCCSTRFLRLASRRAISASISSIFCSMLS